jgi:apolipoprotein D and lipocalin family protein
MKKCFFGLAILLLASCVGIPEKVKPVTGFDSEKYLGTWYEIARLDHSFERGMSKVSANYSLRPDGGIKVTNKGYYANKDRWKTAIGKAYFVGEQDTAHLKVSFYGPFYGSYVVFDLDKENYQYAFVSGPNTSYLWLLSRTPRVDPELINRFVQMAQNAGFDADELIFVEH